MPAAKHDSVCLACQQLALHLQVITDPLTGRSKGYGFVRFGIEAERDRALGEMMGHLISNRPIRVSIATAKKTPPGGPSSNPASAVAPHPSDFDPSNTTLFIGGLSANVTEDDLQNLFGRFGDIIYVKVPPGKGCGFVQYVHRPVAELAMATMQSQVGCIRGPPCTLAYSGRWPTMCSLISYWKPARCKHCTTCCR